MRHRDARLFAETRRPIRRVDPGGVESARSATWLFDLVSGASIKLRWPFLQGRVSLPLVAMADPWLIAICAPGAGGLSVLRRRTFAVAGAVVAAISMFLALKAALMAIAVPQWVRQQAPTTVVHHASKRRGALSRSGTSSTARRTPSESGASMLSAMPTLSFSYRCTDSPLVDASRSLDTVRIFSGCTIWDSRLRRRAKKKPQCCGLTSAIVAAEHQRAIECGLWFGGTFDRDGRPLMQIVRVGDWLQTRPAGP